MQLSTYLTILSCAIFAATVLGESTPTLTPSLNLATDNTTDLITDGGAMKEGGGGGHGGGGHGGGDGGDGDGVGAGGGSRGGVSGAIGLSIPWLLLGAEAGLVF